MQRYLVVFAVLLGCGDDVSVNYAKPRQNEVIDHVWHGYMGQTKAPPSVHWEAGVPCPNNPNAPHVVMAGSICTLGLFRSGTYEIEVIWTGSFSSSALVHELGHAYLQNTVGDANGKHDSPIWQMVGPLNEELAYRGL